MAVLLTPLVTANKAELAFAQLLQTQLGPDYLCWHEVSIKTAKQKRALCPDFIVFNPRYGFWVLEVKEWSLSYIQEHNPKEFTVGSTNERLNSPYLQAEKQGFALKDLLKAQSTLTRNGRFMIPIEWGVIFYNITRQEFEFPEKYRPFASHGKLGNIPSQNVICADELKMLEQDESLERRLLAMLDITDHTRPPLSESLILTIRNAIFPDVQIMVDTSVGKQPDANEIKLLDFEQEKALRCLTNRAHFLFGVAGSGKTILLLNKAQELLTQENGNAPSVLYLCRGTRVAEQIQHQASQMGLPEGTVYSFHKWCCHLLRQQGIGRPKNLSQIPDALIQALKDGRATPQKYDAILLDEGHDFKDRPDWLALIASMRQSNDSLFVMAYDEAQAIYGKGKQLNFHLDFLGVNTKVTKHILRKNYRNTEQILLFAKVFASDFLVDEEHRDVPRVRPLGCGTAGKLPLVLECSSLDDEFNKIADAIHTAHHSGRNWRDIAVLFHTYDFNKLESFAEAIETFLNRMGIPASRKDARCPTNVVKIVSVTKAKGLGFRMVCLVGVSPTAYSHASRENDARRKRENLDEDIRYFYNGITRAVEELVITYTKPQEGKQNFRLTTKLHVALCRVQ